MSDEYMRGVMDTISAFQEAMGEGNYTYNVTDEVYEILGLNEDEEDDEEDF